MEQQRTQQPAAPTATPMTDSQYQQQIQMLQKQNQTAQSQIEAAKAQAAARPASPDFKGLTGPDGKLLSQFQLTDGSQYTHQAMDANQQAVTSGMNNAAASENGAEAHARTSLAMKGGLGAGSALRLAETGQQNLANARQDVQNQGMKNANDINAKAADLSRDAEKTNLSSQISNQSALNQFDLKKYSDQMQEWAAEKSANAQTAAANQGGKKGK